MGENIFDLIFRLKDEVSKPLESIHDRVKSSEAAMKQLGRSLSGEQTITQANHIVAAVERMGGASKLTEAEKRKLNHTLEEALAKYRVLGQDAPAAMVQLAADTKRAEEPTTALSVAVGTLAAQIATKAASAFTSYGKEALMTSARVETLASVARFMGAQAGYSATEIDALAGALQRQGITSAQSYDTIIQLTRANLGLENATKLATVAQSLARATGQNSSQVLGQLIQGTQTLQVEVLRNAGVVVQLDQEYIKFAATAGRAVSTLSAQEKQQIALSAVIREGERVAGVYGVTNQNVGGKIQSLARHQEEASKAIGDVFLPVLRLATDVATTFFQLVKASPETFAALGLGLAGAGTAITTFKGAAALGAISSTTLATALGLIGPAAAVAATGFASWQFGKWLGEITGLTDGGERLAGRLMGLSEADIEASMAARKFIESSDGKKAAAAAQEAAIARLEEKSRAALAAAAEQAKKDAEALEAAREAERQARKLADAMEELRSSGDGWRGTLAQIDEATVRGIKSYLEAGVSQGALATAYELTNTQIKAVASSLAEEKRLLDQSIKAHQDWAKDVVKASQEAGRMWDEYHMLRVQQGGTATEVQIAQIEQWKQQTIAKLKEAGTYTEETYTAIEALAAAKLDAVRIDWKVVGEHSRQSLQDTADKARATFEYILANAEQFAPEVIEKFWRISEEAQASADGWGQSFIDNAGRVTQAIEQTSAAAATAADSWRDRFKGLQFEGTPLDLNTLNANWWKYFDTEIRLGATPGEAQAKLEALRKMLMEQTPKALAGGGTAYAGMMHLVGERGPELFMPRQTGTVVPNHAIGGMTLNMTVNVNTPLGTSSEIARVVGEAVTLNLRQQGYGEPWRAN